MAFVKVASEEFGIRGRQTNVSRVAAMTGLPRKDVSRIRRDGYDYEVDIRVELSPLGDVLHHWSTSPDFLDEAGSPRALDFIEGDLSFTSLVRRCAGDLPAGATKVELIRSGAVSIDEQGRLVLSRRHVVPEDSIERLVSSLSFSLMSLAETIAFNCAPDRVGPGRIERLVQSDCLDEQSKERLRILLREKIAGYTEEVDDMFYQQGSPEAGENCCRIGVGIYYFENSKAG